MPIREEESKTKKLLFGIVIGFVLVSSIIGFTFSAIPFQSGIFQDGTISQSGLDFYATATGVATIINDQPYEFTYFPDELDAVQTSDSVTLISGSRMVYVTSDPNSVLATEISGVEFDLSKALERNYNSFVEVAFTEANRFGKRIITCEDATLNVPVLFFNYTNTTTSVSNLNGCITINVVDDTSLTRIRDKLLYELLGVGS